MSESDFLIAELKRHNTKIYSNIDKFMKTYSAAQNTHQMKVNDGTNNEEYVEKLIKISNLNERCTTDTEDGQEAVEIAKEVVQEQGRQDEAVEKEVVKVVHQCEMSLNGNDLSPNIISSSAVEQKEDLIKVDNTDNSDSFETQSKSTNKLNYFDHGNTDNTIPKTSKTAQALSSLYRVANKLYHLVIPTSNLNEENANDATTTTFINTNFMETDESIQENVESADYSSITSNEITTQTTLKQSDYYVESLQQILYDPFTSIIHKSYCLKHGKRNKLRNKYPRISKDSCYERAANIGNAIKKFEILIQEDQKQEFRFKSETMRQTALFYQKKQMKQ